MNPEITRRLGQATHYGRVGLGYGWRGLRWGAVEGFHLGQRVGGATREFTTNTAWPWTRDTAWPWARQTSVDTFNNVLRPGWRHTREWMSQPSPAVMTASRLRLLVTVGLAVGGTVFVVNHINGRDNVEATEPEATGLQPIPAPTLTVGEPTPHIDLTATPTSTAVPTEVRPTVQPTQTRESEVRREAPRYSFAEPYADKDANEIAKELNINAGTYFKAPKEVVEHLVAFRSADLLPVFPPAVVAKKDLIYRLSEEHKVPANVVAAIMAVESTGWSEAVSSARAQGDFQVMPFHFENEGITDERVMRIPEINGKFGMRVFNDFLRFARSYYKVDFEPNDPRMFVRALMGYNGGGDAVRLPVAQIEDPDRRREDALVAPSESSFYGDHMMRYLIDVEVAARLRGRGFSDAEIIRKMSSEEINARAHMLGNYRMRAQAMGLMKYAEYSAFGEILSQERPWESDKLTTTERERLFADYKEYVDGRRGIRYPTLPALRIWMNLGGISLFESEPKYNTKPGAFFSMNSRKN